MLICGNVLSMHFKEFWANYEFMQFHDSGPQYFGNFTIFQCSRLDMFSYVVGYFFIYAYFKTNHWFLNNYIALSFSIYAIEKFSYTQFWQIALTFIALIAYDVSFVFASDVMMTVATKFNAPMKILIPVRGVGYSMIGIGDIIVPGFLVSMCMRCDFIRNLLVKSVKSKTKEVKSEEQLL